METNFDIIDEVEEEMGIIEEETSDENNSSMESNDSSAKHTKNEGRNKIIKPAQKRTTIETGELSDIKSKDNSTKATDMSLLKNGKKMSLELNSKHNSDFTEEEKGLTKDQSSHHDIREIYDSIRQHRSSSCKSAADPLQFQNKRLLNKRMPSNPWRGLNKRSNNLSQSTSKVNTNIPSKFGTGIRKMSEPSLVDIRKQIETNSKCLSELSWNITHKGSETKNSVPLNRCMSNSSISSEYSGKVGNTSITTLTSDFTWEFRSCKLQPLNIRYRSQLIDAIDPYGRRRDRLPSKVANALPELIECEENLEEEYDLFSNRHCRFNIMKDLNEFGRKSKRHRSLDGRRKRINNAKWDSEVSETEEEDWISDDSLNKDNKKISKFNRIFNKIYADHFERPIRMKQIKERNKRNIKALGDTPINEDSNDSSDCSSKDRNASEGSSSCLSFRKKYVRAFFDKLEQPETKTISLSHKYLELCDNPIQEDENENDLIVNNDVIKSETYERFKSRHERWRFFDNIRDAREPGAQRKNSFNTVSIPFDNEPILEENEEYNEPNDPYYHHFMVAHKTKVDDSKSVNKLKIGQL
jgi:hypothetical protein